MTAEIKVIAIDDACVTLSVKDSDRPRIVTLFLGDVIRVGSKLTVS